jgi:hypothetical protein
MLEVKKIRELTMKKSQALSAAYVSAASGIAVAGKHVYIVADDQLCLACFKLDDDEPGDWLRLFSGDLPSEHAQRKKVKPDLEAICVLPAHNHANQGALLVVSSGSKEWRCNSCLLPLNDAGKIVGEPLPLDLSALFSFLRTKVTKLNIEGVCVYGEKLLLANRGNSKHGDNAIIALDLNKFLHQAYDTHNIDGQSFLFVHHNELGRVKNVPLSFTDLCAISGGQIIYCAAAESTDDDYVDGPCAGSALYVGDGKFENLRTEILDTSLKVEGIYAKAVENGGKEVELILVTDGDADSSIATMLSTRLTL